MNLIAAMHQSVVVTGVVYTAITAALFLALTISYGTAKVLRAWAKAYYYIFSNGLHRKNAAARKSGVWNPGSEVLVEVQTSTGLLRLTMPLSFRKLMSDGTSSSLWACSYFVRRPVSSVKVQNHTCHYPDLPSRSVVYLHNAVSGVVSPL